MGAVDADQEQTEKVAPLENTSTSLPRLLKEIDEGGLLLKQAVLMEMNAWLTVHGTLEIARGGEIRFLPGLDARLLGQKLRQTTLAAIRGVRRMDGGRRVVIGLAEEEWVLRGGAAQQAWVILGAMREAEEEKTGVRPVYLAATLHERMWKAEGVLAIGRQGLGFGVGTEALFSGASSTLWMSVHDLQGLGLEYPGIHLQTAAGGPALSCEAPVGVRDLLLNRWFAAADPALKGASWSRLAVRKEKLSVRMGRLAILPEGLCFVPVGGAAELLIPRRRGGVLELGESGRRSGPALLLLIGADAGTVGEWIVQDPLGCVQELEEHLVDPAWFPPDARADNPVLEGLIGPASYVNLWRGHQRIAGRERVAVAPFGGKLRLKLDALTEPSALPFAVRVEVANGRGRFLLTGILREWVAPDPKRSRRAPPSERQILISLEREIIPDNRRAFYRLPLKEKLPLVLTTPAPTPRNPDPEPTLIEGALLLDLSRKGASLWLPAQIAPDLRVSFELTVELLPESPGREEHEETLQAGSEEAQEVVRPEEVTVESFHLRGPIVYGLAWKIGKETGWRIGIRFDDTVDGFGAFDVRQRAFLRQRAEERESRGY